MTESKKKDDDWWKREEVRGLFVIGVIATLLGAKNFYEEAKLSFGILKGIPISIFIDILLVFWGAYALVMVFATSDDFFSQETISELYKASRMMLMMGVYMLGAYFFLFFILGNIFRLHLLVLPILPSVIGYISWSYIKKQKEEKKKGDFNWRSYFSKYTLRKIISALRGITGGLFMLGYVHIFLYLFNIEPPLLKYQSIDTIIITTILINTGWILLYYLDEIQNINNVKDEKVNTVQE
jgi:hypothetical protein